MSVLPIVTFEQVQGQIGNDLRRDRVMPLIHGTSMQVQRSIGRSLLREAFVEHFDVGYQQQVYTLFHAPVVAITEVWNDGVLIDPTWWREQDGMVQFDRHAPVMGPKYLRITGTGGMAASQAEFEAAYPDIVMEALNWIVIRLRRLAQPDVTNQNVSGTSTSYVSTEMPESLRAVLASYRPGGFA